MSIVGLIQSRDPWRQSRGTGSLRWEGFVEKLDFEPRVKEWWMLRVERMTEMGWQVDEDVNRDKTGEADGMYLKVDYKDKVMRIYASCLRLADELRDAVCRRIILISADL